MKKILILFNVALLINACVPKFKVKHLTYDNDCKLYRYKGEVLRFQDSSIVSHKNIDTFLFQASSDPLIIFRQPREIDFYIKSDDLKLVKEYSSIIEQLNSNKLNNAINNAQALKNKQPELFLFTDIDFIIGKAYLEKNKIDSAIYYFQRFSKYSGQKYSNRFRGYQNKYATNQYMIQRSLVLEQLYDSIKKYPLEILIPRYYFESSSPGYVINFEDFKKTQKSLFYVVLNNQHIGGGLNILVSSNMAFYSQITTNNNYLLFSMYIPYQLYKSLNYRWGIKLSTGNTWQYFYKNQNLKLFPIISISTSYHINHSYYVSVGYVHNFNSTSSYNKDIRSIYTQTYWYSYMHIHLLKGISGRLGFMQMKPVIGITVTGVFIGYNWYTQLFQIGFQGF